MEKEIDELKKKQRNTDKALVKIVEVLEQMVGAHREGSSLWGKNLDLWKANTETWTKFLLTFVLVIFFLLVLTFREEITGIIIWLKDYLFGLSENWRTTLFMALWSLFLVFLVRYIDRKYFFKSSDSKASQNSKDSK